MKNKLLSLVFQKFTSKKSKKFFYYGIFDEKLKEKDQKFKLYYRIKR